MDLSAQLANSRAIEVLKAGSAAKSPQRQRRARIKQKRVKAVNNTEIDQMVEKYEEGATCRQLATEFGIGRERVSRLLRSRDVELRYHNQSLTEEAIRKAARWYGEGDSIAACADRLGVPYETLRCRFIAAGVKVRPDDLG